MGFDYLLYFKVSLLAGALADLGVVKDDRVLIYMPLIPEAIIAMLAVVRIGAIHSVVFGGDLNFNLINIKKMYFLILSGIYNYYSNCILVNYFMLV